MEIVNGMEVLLEDKGRCRIGKILEIQINDKSVERANSGEIGINISEPATKDTITHFRQPRRR